MAKPAVPVNPVSQASRASQGATYSPWCASNRGTIRASTCCRFICSRKSVARLWLSVRIGNLFGIVTGNVTPTGNRAKLGAFLLAAISRKAASLVERASRRDVQR